MQKNDAAGVDIPKDARDHSIGIVCHTVITAGRPAGHLESCAGGGGVDKGIAQSGGSTEKSRVLAGGTMDDVLRGCDFASGARRGDGPESSGLVRPRVILQVVTGVGDGPSVRWVAPNFATDDKKRSPSAMVFEYFENFRRVVRVGAVIDGQPDFALISGQAPQNRPEPRRVRGEGRDQKGGRGGDGPTMCCRGVASESAENRTCRETGGEFHRWSDRGFHTTVKRGRLRSFHNRGAR